MKFYNALAVMAVMTAILSVGVVLLVAGKPLFILATLLVFTVMFIKYGCLAH